MSRELLPDQIVTMDSGRVEEKPVVDEAAASKKEDSGAERIAELQALADAEAATNKAANEDPGLSDEEAEAIGKKAADRAAKKVAGETEKPVEEAYTPNLKYKVLDEEKEIPEWARGLVNKENEEQIREIFQKADAVEHFKSKLGETRQEREQIAQDYQGVQREIQNIVGWRDKNLGIFFEKVGLPKQKVAQWLLQEIEKEELPDHVKKLYTEHEAHQRRVAELEQENSQLSQVREVDMVQARTNELGQVLSAPEVAPLISAFDARVGKPGAFQQMVIRHGHAEWEASGHKTDLTPKEAVDQVLKILNLSQAPSQVATPNETPKPVSAAPTQKVVTAKKPVVLPNVGGGGNAPASKRVKSTDDIRRIYREMSSQN